MSSDPITIEIARALLSLAEARIQYRSLASREHVIELESCVVIVKRLRDYQIDLRRKKDFKSLVEALEGILEKYVSLVNSGDAGFWNPEEVPEVIKARSVLNRTKGIKDE